MCMGSRRQSNYSRNQHHQYLDSSTLNSFSSSSNKFWLAWCSCFDLSEFLILSMIPKELRTCYRLDIISGKSPFLRGPPAPCHGAFACPSGPCWGRPLIRDALDADQTGASVPGCLQARERSALIIPESKRFPASVKIQV